jgi:hypothetical protein
MNVADGFDSSAVSRVSIQYSRVVQYSAKLDCFSLNSRHRYAWQSVCQISKKLLIITILSAIIDCTGRSKSSNE